VRSRWLSLAALAAIAPAAAGCGGVGVSGASESTGNQLSIYSSLPLQGPAGAISQQIVNGERLALAYAGGHIGPSKSATRRWTTPTRRAGRSTPA
jgi:branched-chain amino acid transport system substrate-binding protein